MTNLQQKLQDSGSIWKECSALSWQTFSRSYKTLVPFRRNVDLCHDRPSAEATRLWFHLEGMFSFVMKDLQQKLQDSGSIRKECSALSWQTFSRSYKTLVPFGRNVKPLSWQTFSRSYKILVPFGRNVQLCHDRPSVESTRLWFHLKVMLKLSPHGDRLCSLFCLQLSHGKQERWFSPPTWRQTLLALLSPTLTRKARTLILPTWRQTLLALLSPTLTRKARTLILPTHMATDSARSSVSNSHTENKNADSSFMATDSGWNLDLQSHTGNTDQFRLHYHPSSPSTPHTTTPPPPLSRLQTYHNRM